MTDITQHPTGEAKLYLCAFEDVLSNRIGGYSIDERMTARVATSALRTAVARRQPQGTVIVHADRGGHCASRPPEATSGSAQSRAAGGGRWPRGR